MTATSRRLWDAVWVAVVAATFCAVAAMAWQSALGAHPDEEDHVNAGRYYMRYWDPPRIGDERALDTYSNYGISYLHQLDSVYFLAGKFAALAGPLVGEDYLGLRLFNVALFLWLMLLCFRLRGEERFAFVPLFLTPQAWYVFSYFNGDALPLAMTFTLVYLFVRLHEPGPNRTSGAGTALMGCCLGILCVSKPNYYVFIAFFLSALALSRLTAPPAPRLKWQALAAALAVAAVILGVRLGLDAWSTWGQDPSAATRVAEQTASDEFKPSVQEKGGGYWGSRLRSKGFPFLEMFTWESKWHVFTFRSAFGLYGLMNIETPLLYYRWIGRAVLVFSLLVAAAIAMRGRQGWAALGLWLLFASLTVGQSLWHSWNNDFQPQGRYLFPILAMTGCLLARWGGGLGRLASPARAMALVVWGMSMWSFVAVGLARIPR